MTFFKPLLASACLLATLGASASAQTGLLPQNPPVRGSVIQEVQPNTTGNDPSLVISRGATGADTVTTDSAAGGNANLPERAIPNGSAGGTSR